MGELEVARRASEKGLCPHCLGRLFAKVGRGYSNLERGSALMHALGEGVEDTKGLGELECIIRDHCGESPHSEVRDDCHVCGGLFGEIDKFAGYVAEAMDGWEYNNFLVGTKVDSEIASSEELLWAEVGAEHFEPIKSELNREIGKLVEQIVGVPVEFKRPDIVALVDTRYDNVELTVSPIYIYGRYMKLVRGIPQTRWPCRRCRGRGCDRCGGTGKMYETSVEELVAKELLNATGGEGEKFHGMGREDIDARMLGNGRPFVLEIQRPRRRSLDLDRLEEIVNHSAGGQVVVYELRESGPDEVKALKSAKFPKTYRVLVGASGDVEEPKLNEVVQLFRGKTVLQRTPNRVSHRRADLERERRVIDISAEIIGSNELALRITGEAGIYIKELVHGDEGRTKPSIAEQLETTCEVKELDVLEIHDHD